MLLQTRAKSRGITPPVSTSYLGGEVPPSKEIPLVDYVNMHANNLWQWKVVMPPPFAPFAPFPPLPHHTSPPPLRPT